MKTFRCVRTSIEYGDYGLEEVQGVAQGRVVNIGRFFMAHLPLGGIYCLNDDESLVQTVPVSDGVLCIFKKNS